MLFIPADNLQYMIYFHDLHSTKILSNDKCMELKFIRRWKFSTRNNNHVVNPGIAMRAHIIRRDIGNDFNNQDAVNDSDSDESDSSDNESSDEEDDEVEVLNYFSLFGLDLEYGFAFYLKRLVQCLNKMESGSTTDFHLTSRGVICKRCRTKFVRNTYDGRLFLHLITSFLSKAKLRQIQLVFQ